MDYRNHFGFGCMRLPVLDKKNNTTFNYDKICELFDRYLEKGFKYFDTAYTYHSYHCESAMKKCLVDRHPRESFELCTKLPLRDFKDEEDIEKIFNEQLTNCGVTYFDAYIMHNMGINVYEKCRKYDVYHILKKKKEEGKIKSLGLSFHDSPELLEKILAEFADCLDFVQLQINYVDWEMVGVEAGRCLEVANKYGKPVVVMEPCKGGTLANLPEEADKVLKEYAPEKTAASWAFRFAAGCEGVVRVLSGMNSMEQLEDNMATFENFEPLTEEEMAVIEKAKAIFNDKTKIQCTACEYCTHGCPKDIAIPQYFALYNNALRNTANVSSQSGYYANIGEVRGKAADCIKCGLCEKACPQHLAIREYLVELDEYFKAHSFIPVRR